MAHFVSTTTPLTGKTISKESEKAVKFKAKTKLLTGEITAIKSSEMLIVPGEEITAGGVFPAGTKVVSVNRETKTAVLSQNAEKEAEEELEIKVPVFKPYTWTSQPVQTDFAEYITGLVYAGKAGKLEIQHSFEYPANHENEAKALEGVTWVISPAAITVAGAVGQTFQVFAYAPYFRLVYTNEESEQKEFKLFARAQEKGRI